MTRSQWLGFVAVSGLFALGVAGCHQDDTPSITPQHPVALPPASHFTAPPGKGGTVGQLPTGGTGAGGGAGNTTVNPQAAESNVGSKAH